MRFWIMKNWNKKQKRENKIKGMQKIWNGNLRWEKMNKKYIKKGKRLETGRQSKGKNDRAKIK